jgi:hypothetical protein
MNIIERLRNNKEAFGLMDSELREIAEKIGPDHFRLREFGIWTSNLRRDEFSRSSADGNTFQLRADYVCKHPVQTVPRDLGNNTCSWCGIEIEPEPKAGWVETSVTKNYLEWRFVNPATDVTHHLMFALSIAGFGGIIYRAPCECHGGGDTYFQMSAPPEPCSNHGPWIPVKIRFWEAR